MTRTKQKAMAVFLAIAMVFSMFASLPSAAQAETGETSSLTRCTEKGSGTKEDPYEISDAAQMSDLQTTVDGGETYAGKYFKLTKNLDLTGSMTGPIGSGTKNCFSGTFDGNGNTLTVNIEGDSNGAGLFSCVTGGTVRNLAINGAVTGKYIVGAIAGTLSNATVSNVTVNAAVISTSNGYSGGVGGIAGRIVSGGTSTIDHATMHGDVTLQQWSSYTSGVAEGGIAGLLQGTTMLTNCKNTGTVSNDTSGKTTTAGKGGIVGKANAEASIEDCVNTGTVTGAEGSKAAYLGGIIGSTASKASRIVRCVNEGKIENTSTSSAASTGGIIAYSNGPSDSVTESYNSGEICSVYGCTGGIAGDLRNYSGAEIGSCYNTGSVSNVVKTSANATQDYTGGIAGYARSSSGKASVHNAYNRGAVSTQGTSGYIGSVLGRLSGTRINSDYIYENKYLKETASLGIGGIDPDNDVCTSFTSDDDMNDVLETLGDLFASDMKQPVNEGYPILRWQNPEAGYPVKFNVTDQDTGEALDGAEVQVEGKTAAENGTWELKTGEYRYTVSKAGFETKTGTFHVGKKGVTVDVPLNAVKHTWKLTAFPANARIVVKNETLGTMDNPEAVTDQEKNTAVYSYALTDEEAYGAYQYEISAYGYEPESGNVVLNKDEEHAVTLKKAATQTLTMKVKPAEADVSVTLTSKEYHVRVKADNVENNIFTYQLPAGQYEYAVKASGYTTQRGSITVKDAAVSQELELAVKSGWDGESVDTDWYTEHPDADTYEISEPEELAGLAQLVNHKADGSEAISFGGKTIKLTKDINLNGFAWTPIGTDASGKANGSTAENYPFEGTFDGQGHKVTGLNKTYDEQHKFCQGFFGHLKEATVKDLTLSGTVTQGWTTYAGGVSALATRATFDRVIFEGKVEADKASYIGGFAGRAIHSIFRDCVNRAEITGKYQAGGIVGQSYGPSYSDSNKEMGCTLTRCVNEGNITVSMTGTTTTYASGGIIGAADHGDQISHCINRGTISGSNVQLGGIAGILSSYQQHSSSLTHCYNAGIVKNGSTSDKSHAGGIAGYLGGSSYYSSSGVVDLKNNANFGEVTCETGSAGAVLGGMAGSTISAEHISDNYYLRTDALTGLGTGSKDPEGSFEAFDRDDSGEYSELIRALGSEYQADQKDGDHWRYNGGFPILKWQNPDALFTVDFAIDCDVKDNQGEDQPVVLVKDSNGEAKKADQTEDGSIRFQLHNGTYTYTVSRKGYETQKGTFTVARAGRTEELTLKAVKYDYTVKVDDDVDFTLQAEDGTSIDLPEYDKEAGGYTFHLYNGTYTYRATKFGSEEQSGKETIAYQEKALELHLALEQTYPVKFEISPVAGTFSGTDPQVLLYVNSGTYKGKLLGTYNQENSALFKGELRLPPGSYRYRAKAEGFDTRSGFFTVDGQGQTVRVELLTKSGWGGDEDVDTDWYTDHPDADTYTIQNESELAGLARLSNDGTTDFSGKTIELERDLNMKDSAWTPAAKFCGTFKGNGHAITFTNGRLRGLTVEQYNNKVNFVGLFADVNGAEISGLTLHGNIQATITPEENATLCQAYAGGLAGRATSSTFKNCYNQMNLDITVDADEARALINIGGLVGWSVYSSYEQCSNISAVSGSLRGSGSMLMCQAGGLVGLNNAQIGSNVMTSCYNTGQVSAVTPDTAAGQATVGGLIGSLGAQTKTFTMNSCYNAGAVSAAGGKVAAAHALVGTGTNGTFSNNYYLQGDGVTENTAHAAAKTDEEMRSADFVRVLNAGGGTYLRNGNGGYPIFIGEQTVQSIAVTKLPDKTSYQDLESFDDTGMELQVNYGEGIDPVGLASGWTVKDGKSLKAGQKEVTIEYKGVTTTVPVTVKQVVHPINAEDLTFHVTAPKAGEMPQDALALTDAQKEKFDATLQWTHAGKAFRGTFDKASYYRLEVTLKARYEEGEVYYAFRQNAQPEVEGAYEVKYLKRGTNRDGEADTMTFAVTFRATTSATEGLSDKVSHLYYEGDEEAPVDFDAYLSNQLTISGTAEKDKSYTVKDLEQMVLDRNVGNQAEYSGKGRLAGIRLYDLLRDSGMSENLADETEVIVYGSGEQDKVTLTMNDLRRASGSKSVMLSYGNADNGIPFGKASGPLCLVQYEEDASSLTCVRRIAVKAQQDAVTQKLTLSTNVKEPEILVKDQYGSTVEPQSDGTYVLRSGEAYQYKVSKDGYASQSGEVTLENKDQTIKVDLTPCWDGKTLTEPEKDESGYYLIGSAAELMWWNKNSTQKDKVRLTADIALNDGNGSNNQWPLVFGKREDAAFQGEFDGRGHVISGFYIDRENKYELELHWDGVYAFADRISQIGMFGYLHGATVKNLGLEGNIKVYDRPDGSHADWMQVGGIAGYVHGSSKIENCYTNLGITVQASTETGSVGGYPVSGYGDKCDLYIGGIAGSLSGASTIENCYAKGSYVGAYTRRVDIGGIAGGMRDASSAIDRCYSTSSIQAVERDGSTWKDADGKSSRLGGIVGDALVSGSDRNGAVRNSFGLAGMIRGNVKERITAGRVAGRAGTLSGNYGMRQTRMESVTESSEEGEATLNGAVIDQRDAEDFSRYQNAGWSNDNWKAGHGDLPMLTWQTKSAGKDRTAEELDPAGEEKDDEEWDGYFSSKMAPPYFKMNFKVAGHDTVLSKKFTRSELKQLAAEDHAGNLYYSSKSYGGNAGRAVTEYVNLETLLKQAGVLFRSGDTLAYGNYYTYSYDYLMADRYYYPEWTSGSDAGKVKIKPVIAMKSNGAKSGVAKDNMKNYAAQADYLRAYMLTFGQTTPGEETYGYFTYNQVDATVNYAADEAANTTVRGKLEQDLEKAEQNLNATAISADGEDVARGNAYTGQSAHDAFAASIAAAGTALEKKEATNDTVMNAVEALAKAEKAFNKAKKEGAGVNRQTLQNTIDLAKSILAKTETSQNGKGISEDILWATREDVQALQETLNEAVAVMKDSKAGQSEYDNLEFQLRCKLEDFAVQSGKLEPNARASAIEGLTKMADGLNPDDYRAQEQQEIKTLLEQWTGKIRAAKGMVEILSTYQDAKAAIGSVRTAAELEAEAQEKSKQKAADELKTKKKEAKKTLDSLVDLDQYDEEEQKTLRLLLLETGNQIDQAAGEDEINTALATARTKAGAVKTSRVKTDELQNTKDAAAKELQQNQETALRTLKGWYNKLSDYSKPETAQVKRLIQSAEAAVNQAATVDEVQRALLSALVQLQSVPTTAHKNAVAEKAFQSKTIKLKKAKKGKKKLTAKWKKVRGAKGYQIRLTWKAKKVKKTRNVNVTGGRKTKKTVKKLKKGRKYTVRVRAWNRIGGKKVYSRWSGAKKVRCK